MFVCALASQEQLSFPKVIKLMAGSESQKSGKSLINGHKMASAHHKSGPIDFISRDGRRLSFANVVRSGVGSQRAPLKGWRCSSCESWDVYAASLGEEQGGRLDAQDSPACVNQFQVPKDLLENYLASDSSSSCCFLLLSL